MAQLIHCDYEGCDKLYDMMVTRQADGESLAWCGEHFLMFCQQVADQAAQAEADAAAAEAAARLEATRPGSTDTDPANVVKRGTSRSRRRHEAKRREHEAAAVGVVAESSSGPDDDEPDDADELAAPS